MSKLAVIFSVLACSCAVQASWYWPFGSDDDDGAEPVRISELMSPVSLLIDDASDLAGDGKVDEAVEKYRKALAELDRIERENPERAKSSEFATLRNKRAYVNAAIDSMLLSQVKQNARAVAVSDTTELEKKLAAERSGKGGAASAALPTSWGDKLEDPDEEKPAEAIRQVQKPRPAAKPSGQGSELRDRAIAAVASGDYVTAERVVGEMLAQRPHSAAALNLRAAIEMRQGKLDAAETTLDLAIAANPDSHSAYYNMAMLLLQRDAGNKAEAKRYYEVGRGKGGPKNAELEALTK